MRPRLNYLDRSIYGCAVCAGKVVDEATAVALMKKAKLVPIQKFVNHTFTYHTFFCQVDKEFYPILNDEHCGYAWVGDNQYPKPLHPGLFNTVNFDIVQEKLKALTKKET